MLHSQSAKWKDRVLLERNFTMNGNWMDYYGKWTKGGRSLALPVWGDSRIPFVVQAPPRLHAVTYGDVR